MLYINCYTTGRIPSLVYRIPYSKDIWSSLTKKAKQAVQTPFYPGVEAKCWLGDKQYWLVDEDYIYGTWESKHYIFITSRQHGMQARLKQHLRREFNNV